MAWSFASALSVFCGSISLYSPSLCLSPVYLSFLPSSWLEYWWSSLWIWLNPCSAESDSRHKYLGASERERNESVKDRVSIPDKNRCDLTGHRVTQPVSSKETSHYIIRTNFILFSLCLHCSSVIWWGRASIVTMFNKAQTLTLEPFSYQSELLFSVFLEIMVLSLTYK